MKPTRALLASGAEVTVVAESLRDAGKPALLLGDTQFAKESGIAVTKLRDWSYVQRVIGRDVVIAGHDHAAKGQTQNKRRPNWDRVGTAKAAVDFLRQFMGVRFLYPDVFARYHLLPREKVDRAIWSSTIPSTSMEDRSVFGEIVFR